MYHLSIVTPEKVVLDTKVTSVVAPGKLGYLQILTDHAPIMTSLQPGRLEVRLEDGKLLVFAVSGGFLEVSKNNATLLADAIEAPDEIDIERAKKAMQRAKGRLESEESPDDKHRAMEAFLRARNRIKIAESKNLDKSILSY